jgi:hypothetical protein
MEVAREIISLGKAHGHDMVHRVWAAMYAATYKDWLTQDGFKVSQSVPCCYRLTTHGQHQHHVNFMRDCYPPACDHPKLLLKNGSPKRFTSEPYGLGMDELERMIKYARKHNLRFCVRAESPHFLGRTVLVEWECDESST